MEPNNITPGATPHHSWMVTGTAILIAVLAILWWYQQKSTPQEPSPIVTPPVSVRHITPTTTPPQGPPEVSRDLDTLDAEFAQLDTDLSNIDDLDNF